MRKQLFIGVGTVVGLVFLLTPFSVPANAYESTIYNDNLDVSGVVLPTQSVIVDEQNVIQAIYSNTDEDVVPRVYRNSIDNKNRIDLSDEINAQFRNLVPYGSGNVGVLYKKSDEPKQSSNLIHSLTGRISAVNL